MIAVDTSVAVAGFGAWHRRHDEARDLLDEGVAVPAHALLETWSVLTGFPPPHRAPTDIVGEWLEGRFDAVLPSPSVTGHRDLVRRLAQAGRPGGAVYDGLVGMTAKASGAMLVTADRRAARVYELLDVEHRFLVT